MPIILSTFIIGFCGAGSRDYLEIQITEIIPTERESCITFYLNRDEC